MAIYLTSATGGEPLLCLSATLRMPWIGVWTMDIDLDLGVSGLAPEGKVTVTINDTEILVGTVDPVAGGALGKDKGHLRILGGGGGWSKTVRRQHWGMPTGVPFSLVLTATAASIGEVATEVPPTPPASTSYARYEGPAARILQDKDWRVEPLGMTIVGVRLPVVFNPITQAILGWNPLTQTAEIDSQAIVLPGTVLVDDRIGGTTTIRSTEQTWDSFGGRATCVCSEEAPSHSNPIVGALKDLIAGQVQREYVESHEYRIVLQDIVTGKLTVQSVKQSGPDMIPLPVYGTPGITATHVPGTKALVTCLEGDPNKPIVHSFEQTLPTELQLDAIVRVAVGGLPALPVALAAPIPVLVAQLQAQISALATMLSAVSGAVPGIAVPLATMNAGIAAANATIATTLPLAISKKLHAV